MKKEKHFKNLGYVYDKEELLKTISENVNFLLNKAQVQILFPFLTSNKIKYLTSPRCNKKDELKCVRFGKKPMFKFHVVNQYVAKRTGIELVTKVEEETIIEETVQELKGKKGKKGKNS